MKIAREEDGDAPAGQTKLEPTPPAVAAPEGSRGRAPPGTKPVPAAVDNADDDDDYG
eukprot:COSAG02_NODE_27393_length_610_cov_3.356164_1_plen_57_part_00